MLYYFVLTEHCHEGDDFHFVTPDDQIVKTFSTHNIEVTALYFEKRCTSLFVGYSFGLFQVFDLKELAIR